jgi:hypothetical protein
MRDRLMIAAPVAQVPAPQDRPDQPPLSVSGADAPS